MSEITHNGVGDHALQTATGKTWTEWFAILDAAGAHKWPPVRITRLLCEEYGVREWWCGTIMEAYASARGIRVKKA
jgi:hypothetical protein